MRVAVIGGGAAGMTTAYYLSKTHDVILFEREADIGGNVQTAGKNSSSQKLPAHLRVDNGVIEFYRDFNPLLISLLDELDIEIRPIPYGSSALFLENGESYQLPPVLGRMTSFTDKIEGYWKLVKLLPQLVRILIRYRLSRTNRFGDVLDDDVVSDWFRMLMMYGFSMPYSTINEFPTDVAMNVMGRTRFSIHWFTIEGGVFSYLEAIRQRQRFEIHTNAKEIKVKREECPIVTVGSKSFPVDAVVIATPPQSISDILVDASEEELRNFQGWKVNQIETLIHTDTSIYNRWQPPEYTEFDLFELKPGSDAGYNVHINRVANLPENPAYFIAYNLEDRIDPECILHRHIHETTFFEAENTRAEILSLSGCNNTYFAGAYLFDGLQEGAVASALEVVRKLGTSAER